MKRFLSLAFSVILAAFLAIPALAVVDKSDSFYVADYADILSPATEELIINYNGALEQQCKGAQFVVVTVNSLEGMYSDEYALQLMNDWGVGDAEENNGMLLVYCPSDDRGWLAQGYGIASHFTSDDANDMLDSYFWNDADAGRYDEAVTSLLYQVLGWYDGYYGANVIASNPDYQAAQHQPDGGYVPNPYQPEPAHSSGSIVSSLFSVLLVIVVVVVVFSSMTRGRRGYYRGGGYRTGGSIWPWFFLGNMMGRRHRPPFDDHHHDHNDHDDHWGGFGGGSGFGGGGFGGGGFGGFGGGSGFGGGGFGGGGGGGRR